MNNLQQDLQPNQQKKRPLFDSLTIEPDLKIKQSKIRDRSLQRGISQLPLERKIGLISGLSFGGLMTLSIAGGLILYSSLTTRLLKQTESKLIAKSQIVELLLSEEKIDNSSVLDRAVAAITEESDYTAVYLSQNGGLALSASSQNIDSEPSKIALTNKEILNSATTVEGIVSRIETIEGDRYALAAKTVSDRTGQLGVVIHGSSFNSVYNILKSSLLTQAVLSILLWLLIFYWGKILVKAIVLPLDNLLQVVENFTWGNWQARSLVNTADKIGALSNTLNVLADSLEFNEVRLTQEAERSRILKETAFDISLTTDVSEILHITVENARKILLCDRIIYQNFASSEDRIIAESVDEEFSSALGLKIDGLEAGKTIAIADIARSELPDDCLEVLKSLAVVAVLVIPVAIEDNLIGWLIAHQCSEARIWQDEEINLLSQIAFGLGRAIEKIQLLEKQQQAQKREQVAKENLQRRALELLMEVEPVRQGDLTIQVKVKEDEIGTIADSYNATIESLRKLVAQVKTAAIEVSTTTSDKDRSIQELSKGASAQTQEINAALQRIQGITDSISAVAKNAKAAEAAMLKAVNTVKAGDEAMTQTVEGFQEIRDTVAATAKKVKRLGESSQKISKVVSVINNFAEQTNLLALNASIEAAHAGEEGRGFAVVADEVRSLARQSASATAEIEALVAEIQTGTNQVVAAMEAGTQQVVAGTKLVDKTRFSLTEIADVSQEIDRLVAEIAIATVEQSQNSEVVSQTMKQVAAISDKTATEAGEVSASFKDLLTVAQQLQDSVAKFKVS